LYIITYTLRERKNAGENPYMAKTQKIYKKFLSHAPNPKSGFGLSLYKFANPCVRANALSEKTAIREETIERENRCV
tara:strand:- start:1945 stop:2175 length:231 start_codon:yes stop_codon:yes gene_type:complete